MRARPASLVSDVMQSSPLRRRAFRHFYFGSIGAALGYAMQLPVAAWLMATLTPSALMVALAQTASTLPTLVFGLVAGTLADIVERPRIIFFTQIVLLLATAVLGIATLTGLIGPMSLLALTVLVGAGFTFYQPAQQASTNLFPPTSCTAPWPWAPSRSMSRGRLGRRSPVPLPLGRAPATRSWRAQRASP